MYIALCTWPTRENRWTHYSSIFTLSHLSIPCHKKISRTKRPTFLLLQLDGIIFRDKRRLTRISESRCEQDRFSWPKVKIQSWREASEVPESAERMYQRWGHVDLGKKCWQTQYCALCGFWLSTCSTEVESQWRLASLLHHKPFTKKRTKRARCRLGALFVWRELDPSAVDIRHIVKWETLSEGRNDVIFLEHIVLPNPAVFCLFRQYHPELRYILSSIRSP